MGKKKNQNTDTTSETKTSKTAYDEPDGANYKKPNADDKSNIIQFVEPRKKKKRSESEIIPVENSCEKKLRFNIDGEVVQSKSETDEKGNNSAVKKKIRKPRWTEERKMEEREKKSSEPPIEQEVRHKSKKKKKGKKVQLQQEGTTALATSAIQYLQNWQYDRSSWKFSKTKQTWLLKNIFDLKKYVSGLNGGSRLKTHEAALKVIQKLEEKTEAGDTKEDEIAKCLTEESEEDKEEIHQRARSVMQTLSDCT